MTLIWDLGSKMAHHLPESNQNDPKKERMMRMIVTKMRMTNIMMRMIMTKMRMGKIMMRMIMTTMPWSRRGNGGW